MSHRATGDNERAIQKRAIHEAESFFEASKTGRRQEDGEMGNGARCEVKSLVLLRGHDFATRGVEPRSPNVISPVSAERNFWILGLEAAAVFEEQATAILNAYHRSLWSIRNPVSVIHWPNILKRDLQSFLKEQTACDL